MRSLFLLFIFTVVIIGVCSTSLRNKHLMSYMVKPTNFLLHILPFFSGSETSIVIYIVIKLMLKM